MVCGSELSIDTGALFTDKINKWDVNDLIYMVLASLCCVIYVLNTA